MEMVAVGREVAGSEGVAMAVETAVETELGYAAGATEVDVEATGTMVEEAMAARGVAEGEASRVGAAPVAEAEKAVRVAVLPEVVPPVVEEAMEGSAVASLGMAVA